MEKKRVCSLVPYAQPTAEAIWFVKEDILTTSPAEDTGNDVDDW